MSIRRTVKVSLDFVQMCELEPRVLLAGDTGIAIAESFDSTVANDSVDRCVAVVENARTPDFRQHAALTDLAPCSIFGETLVFIDQDIGIDEVFLQSIPSDATVILLEPAADPLLQITETLQRSRKVRSIHILSHGGSGELLLGGARVDLRAINDSQQLLALWQSVLMPGADLLIYGCDVAAGSAGTAFLKRFSELTGMDVAASTDKTGNAKLGGNWALEARFGAIETCLVISPWLQSHYTAVLTATFLDAKIGALKRYDVTYSSRFNPLFSFDDFSNTAGLRLNGTATSNGNSLELTQVHGGLGSAFATKSLNISADTSFRTQFQFRIDGGQGSQGADGFVFMLQNHPAGLSTLASTKGEGLGYAGTTKSLAIEFDTYRNPGEINDNHIAVLANGDLSKPLATSPVPFDLNSGKKIKAWIEYDGKTNLLSIYLSETENQPKTAVLRTRVDLTDLVGSQAYAGFASATGSYVNRHEIVHWKLEAKQPHGVDDVDVILEWNEVLLNANAVDHTLAKPDQGGPILTSQAFALVSGAMYDAYNSINPIGTEFTTKVKQKRPAVVDAAVAQAAHDTLVALYPSQKATFQKALTNTLNRIANGSAENEGRRVGAKVAEIVLHARSAETLNNAFDNATYTPKPYPGFHDVDPLHRDQGFYGAGAMNLQSLVIPDTESFAGTRLDDGTPAGRLAFLSSDLYTEAYNELLVYGGDGITSPTQRTVAQTQIGIFWGYDGRPEIGTPPRLYNQIVRTVAMQEGNTEAENARLFALVNVAMADAGLASWETKYDDEFWRPVLGIRQGDPDGNAATLGIANWNPLGAPASNPKPGDSNFTPNFPAYTSGHATFGAAAFETLENFYGTDAIGFSFVSDEFNGKTRDADGSVRPLVERTFSSFTEAKLENAQSRIYLGIHWNFDATEGVTVGDRVADYVFANALRSYS